MIFQGWVIENMEMKKLGIDFHFDFCYNTYIM